MLRSPEQDEGKRAESAPGTHSPKRGQVDKDAVVVAEDKAPELHEEDTRAERQEAADVLGVGNLAAVAALLEDNLAEAGRVEDAGCALFANLPAL